MVCFFRIVVLLLFTLAAVALSAAFEKITIKPDPSADPRSMRLQVLSNGNLLGHAVLVSDLLSYAYDLPSNPSPRLTGLPEWTYVGRYDVEAKAPVDASSTSSVDSYGQIRFKEMIRDLLAKRCKLVMRVQPKRMPAYALVISGGGPKVQRSANTARNCIFDTAPEGCHNFVIGFGHPLNAKAVSMDDLAQYLENWTDLPVVNGTKLNGLFTVHTEGWQPMLLPPPRRVATATWTSAGFPLSLQSWPNSV